jgi:formylmethanofuran dehydrogenase subunit B
LRHLASAGSGWKRHTVWQFWWRCIRRHRIALLAAVAHRLREWLPMTPAVSPWTCPFCPLMCDRFAVRRAADGRALVLDGSDCARARAGLAQFGGVSQSATPRVDGRAASLADAVAAAARLLRASRQPLFGGLGTDVAGARALYRLACSTGAICDAAQGGALTQSLRALQDRGGFTTTLAEVRSRADVIVFIGGLGLDHAPLLFDRLGFGDAAVARRHVVAIGASAQEQLQLGALGRREGIHVESLPLQGDLFETMSLLCAAVSQSVPNAPPQIAALAVRLRDARYGVLIGTPMDFPAHAALLIECVNRIVGRLNTSTRAAALWLGGGNGAATVNQVFTWLSGLPLRSRAGPRGVEHEPLRFDRARLLEDGAVDALMWLSSFDADSAPPPTELPLIVLGHPKLAASCDRKGSVFIPVSTPGIGSAGHLFRTDGVVLLPLFAVHDDGLPSVAGVITQITQELFS